MILKKTKLFSLITALLVPASSSLLAIAYDEFGEEKKHAVQQVEAGVSHKCELQEHGIVECSRIDAEVDEEKTEAPKTSAEGSSGAWAFPVTIAVIVGGAYIGANYMHANAGPDFRFPLHDQ